MKKSSAILLATLLGISLLSGCGEKKKVILNDDKTSQSVATPIISPNNEEKGDTLELKDYLEVEGEDGGLRKFDINLVYKINPEVDKFYMIHYDELEINADAKEQIVKAYFGDAEVFSGDDEDMTSTELLVLINMCEDALEEDLSEVDREYYQGLLSQYREYLKTAGNEKVPISDYNHNSFVGYIEGLDKECMVGFYGATVQLGQRKVDTTIIYIGYSCSYRYTKHFEVVKADYCTNEEAELVANELLERAGLIPIEVYGDLDDNHKLAVVKGNVKTSYPDRIYVGVINNKISYLEIPFPRGSYELYDNVEHISLDEVKNILLDILKNHSSEFYQFEGYYKLNDISLEYIELDNNGKSFLTPVWKIGDFIVINAIDGSYEHISYNLVN